MISHSDACNEVIFVIQCFGGRAWRREVGLFYDERGGARKIGVAGQGDVYGYLPPLRYGHLAAPIEVEVKTGQGRRREEQKRWAHFVKKMGALYHLARFNDLVDGRETLASYLKEIGYVRVHS